MVQPRLALPFPVQYRLDSVYSFEQLLDFGDTLGQPDINMGHLVVRHRECLGGARVQHLPFQLRLDPHQPRPAQHPVDVHRAAHRGDAVLGQDHDPRPVPLEVLDQLAADGVDLPQVARDGRVLRPQPLQTVVQVRKVDQRQGGTAGVVDVAGAVGDPAAGADVCRGAPEVEQRKGAELPRQLRAQLRRLRVDVRQLAPVGRIQGARRHRSVHRAVHVVPPEQLGAGKRRVTAAGRLPHLFSRHQRVALLPEPHLGGVAEVPAVRHRAVLAREEPRGEGGLHRAGHRG